MPISRQGVSHQWMVHHQVQVRGYVRALANMKSRRLRMPLGSNYLSPALVDSPYWLGNAASRQHSMALEGFKYVY